MPTEFKRASGADRESARLAALARYLPDDDSTDRTFERLTYEVATRLEVPIAFLSLVGEDRIWLKARHGVAATLLHRDPDASVATLLPDRVYAMTAEADASLGSQTLAALDEAAGMRAFAAAPLKTFDGHVLGSLCIMDERPRVFGEDERSQLHDMAAAVMHRLEMRHSLRRLHQVEHGLQRHEQRCPDRETPDEILGLPGRRGLWRHLDRLLERQGDDGSAALLLLDLDRFKRINARLGHSAGDAVLGEITQRLERCLGPGELLARWSGDTLAVVLHRIEDPDRGRAAGERLQAVISNPIQVAGQEVTASATVGVACVGDGVRNADELLRDAETALDRAKDAGPGSCVVFQLLEHGLAVDRLRLEDDLHHAVDRNQLRLHFQPLISLATGRLHAVEAFVRWAVPGHGLLWPRDFLPLAAKHDLIGSISDWAIEESVRTLAEWRQRFGDQAPGAVHVNLAAAQLADPSLGRRIRRLVHENGLQVRDVVLTVSEQTVVHLEQAEAAIEALHREGLRLHVENLGTVYTSLGYLHRLPVEAIKIDRSVIAEMLANPRQLGMVRGLTTLGHHLGMEVIAEGVESSRQLRSLVEIGCDHAQGYHLMRPVDRGTMNGLLGSQTGLRKRLPVQ